MFSSLSLTAHHNPPELHLSTSIAPCSDSSTPMRSCSAELLKCHCSTFFLSRVAVSRQSHDACKLKSFALCPSSSSATFHSNQSLRGPYRVHLNKQQQPPAGQIHQTAAGLISMNGAQLQCAQIRGEMRIRYSALSRNDGAQMEQERAATHIVWFKHDLRLDDHPALHSLQHSDAAVLPVFIFDPTILAGLPQAMLPPLLAAVSALRANLRSRGSDLVVREGCSATCLLQLVDELPGASLITEEEMEDVWTRPLDAVESVFSSTAKSKRTRVTTWRAPIFKYDESISDFKVSKETRGKPLTPLPPPSALPPLPAAIHAGSLPSIDKILLLAASNRRNTPSSTAPVDALPADSVGSKSKSKNKISAQQVTEGDKAAAAAVGEGEGRGGGVADDIREEEFALSDGENSAAATLEGYLRTLEASSNASWQSIARLVFASEVSPHVSFPTFFSTALSLGLLSARRVHHQAIAYEMERSGGRLSPFGFSSFCAKAAVVCSEATDWYQHLARCCKNSESSRREEDESSLSSRPSLKSKFWRWRGALIEYHEAPSRSPPLGPPILLVHGFGAFSRHFARCLPLLASAGCRVWAVTLPGFGRSEKPFVSYSQFVWSDFVRDFVTQVIGEPVALAGNSIGGYTVATTAAECPDLVSSLVLLNSAGRLVPNYNPKLDDHLIERNGGRQGPPRFFAFFLSRLLFAYLQSNTTPILRRCYPINPEAADDELLAEISRAANDPGAVQVVESVFYLPKPRPLNFLIDKFGGPVLVLQGKHDPLNDAVGRANLIKQLCPSSALHFIEAGHCPHDEAHEDVSKKLIEWLQAKWCTIDVADSSLSSVNESNMKAGLEPAGPLDILKEEAEVLFKRKT